VWCAALDQSLDIGGVLLFDMGLVCTQLRGPFMGWSAADSQSALEHSAWILQQLLGESFHMDTVGTCSNGEGGVMECGQLSEFFKTCTCPYCIVGQLLAE
jgi:hypothetical protein